MLRLVKIALWFTALCLLGSIGYCQTITILPGSARGINKAPGGFKTDSILWLPIRNFLQSSYANPNQIPDIGRIGVSPHDSNLYFSPQPNDSLRILTIADTTLFPHGGSVYNYWGTIIHSGDSIQVDSTLLSTIATVRRIADSAAGAGSNTADSLNPGATIDSTLFTGGHNIGLRHAWQAGVYGAGGTVVVSGSVTSKNVGFSGTILKWEIAGDGSTGSVTVAIKKNGSDIIGTGTAPSISSSTSATALVSGWTSTTVSHGDILAITFNSVSTFTQITLTLTIQQNP